MKKKGVGISSILHPTGRKGGGDPSQAVIQLKPDGSLLLMVGAVDLGQGALTILRQVAADFMDVPIETIYASNNSDDLTPLSSGSAASRVTLVDPHAVVEAVEDLKTRIREYVAPKLNASPEEIDVAGAKAFVRAEPDRAMTMREIGTAANMGDGKILIGNGAWQPAPVHAHDPETGALDLESVIAFGCCVAEVEVDTETGQVDVTKIVHVWEVGKAINPLMVRQQINGGLHISLGFTLLENMYPYYPQPDGTAGGLNDYVLPTFMDYPEELIHGIEEVPHPMGVKGAKGFSEGCAGAPAPAIVSAIHDAIGVWIHETPVTPEVVLRALEAKEEGRTDYWSMETRFAF